MYTRSSNVGPSFPLAWSDGPRRACVCVCGVSHRLPSMLLRMLAQAWSTVHSYFSIEYGIWYCSTARGTAQKHSYQLVARKGIPRLLGPHNSG
jgi:hypothetical protein